MWNGQHRRHTKSLWNLLAAIADVPTGLAVKLYENLSPLQPLRLSAKHIRCELNGVSDTPSDICLEHHPIFVHHGQLQLIRIIISTMFFFLFGIRPATYIWCNALRIEIEAICSSRDASGIHISCGSPLRISEMGSESFIERVGACGLSSLNKFHLAFVYSFPLVFMCNDSLWTVWPSENGCQKKQRKTIATNKIA